MSLTNILLILMALVGFFLLAAVLLIPAYLFLKRESIASEQWTPEALARRAREMQAPPNDAAQQDITYEEGQEDRRTGG